MNFQLDRTRAGLWNPPDQRRSQFFLGLTGIQLRQLSQRLKVLRHEINRPLQLLRRLPKVTLQLPTDIPQRADSSIENSSEVRRDQNSPRCSELNAREHGAKDFYFRNAFTDRNAQIFRHHVKVRNEIRKRLRIDLLSIYLRDIVITHTCRSLRNYSTGSQMKQLDFETDVGNSGHGDRMAPPCDNGLRSEPHGCDRSAYGPYRGPSIPPHYAATLPRGPAGADGVPPTHRATYVSTGRHSATEAVRD